MGKQTIDVDVKWWHFSQNNSGGRFIVDMNVAHDVWIQARNSEEAIQRAHAILDDSGEDWCECCGERWYFWVLEEDGADEPTIYGQPLSKRGKTGVRDEGRLHHFDGRIESVKFDLESA